MYKNKARFCGFYPAGLKVLRFREDDINDIIQNGSRMAVRLHQEREAVHGKRFQNKKGCGGSGVPKEIRRQKRTKTDDLRHGF